MFQENTIKRVERLPGTPQFTVKSKHRYRPQDFAELLGTFVLPSVYGETFEIKAKNDPNNLPYSNLGCLGQWNEQ